MKKSAVPKFFAIPFLRVATLVGTHETVSSRLRAMDPTKRRDSITLEQHKAKVETERREELNQSTGREKAKRNKMESTTMDYLKRLVTYTPFIIFFYFTFKSAYQFAKIFFEEDTGL